MSLPVAPGLALACWNAAVRSLLAVCGIASLVGIFFIPDEIERLSVPPVRCVRQCVALPSGTSFAAIESNLHPHLTGGVQSRLAAYQWQGDVAYRSLLEFPPNPVCVASHPRGFPLFVSRPNGEIRAVNQSSSGWSTAALVGRHAQGHAEKLACTADGRTLVSSDVDCLYVWDLEGWKLRWRLTWGEVACWCLHPDSRRLICCRDLGDECAVQELDLETGRATTIFECRSGAWRSLQVGSRGLTIIGVNAEGQLRIWRQGDEQSWQLAKLPPIEPLPDRLYALSPDEAYLAVAQVHQSCLQIWNLQSVQPVHHLALEVPKFPIGIRFHSADELLAWGSRDALWVWEFTRSDRATTIPILEADSPR